MNRYRVVFIQKTVDDIAPVYVNADRIEVDADKVKFIREPHQLVAVFNFCEVKCITEIEV